MPQQQKTRHIIDRLLSVVATRRANQYEVESRLGWPPSRISKWKDGTGEITAQQAAEFADLYGISVEWLVTGRGGEEKEMPPADETARDKDENAILVIYQSMGISVKEAVRRLVGLDDGASGRKAELDSRQNGQSGQSLPRSSG